MVKLWVVGITEIVDDQWFHLLTTAGQKLQRSVRFVTSLGNVKDTGGTAFCVTVMAGDCCDKLGGITRTWNLAREEHTVRPVGIASVVGFLIGTVLVHGHEDSAEVMSRVRVFPANIHYPAV